VIKEIKAEINRSHHYYSDISQDRDFLLGLNVRNCVKLSLNLFGYGVCKLPTSTVNMNSLSCIVIQIKYQVNGEL
jgi:hypothetical protein